MVSRFPREKTALGDRSQVLSGVKCTSHLSLRSRATSRISRRRGSRGRRCARSPMTRCRGGEPRRVTAPYPRSSVRAGGPVPRGAWPADPGAHGGIGPLAALLPVGTGADPGIAVGRGAGGAARSRPKFLEGSADRGVRGPSSRIFSPARRIGASAPGGRPEPVDTPAAGLRGLSVESAVPRRPWIPAGAAGGCSEIRERTRGRIRSAVDRAKPHSLRDTGKIRRAKTINSTNWPNPISMTPDYRNPRRRGQAVNVSARKSAPRAFWIAHETAFRAGTGRPSEAVGIASEMLPGHQR